MHAVLPRRQSGVHVEVADFARARRDEGWHAWHALSEHAPPFLAPEFFALNRPLSTPGAAMVAEAYEAGRLIGALPLVLADHTLHALRGEHTPGFDYLGSREGLDAIWHELRHDRRWDVLLLKNVPADSLLATHLVSLAQADGCPAVVKPGSTHAYFELQGFEARLSSKFLTNLKRCARKAGGIELENIAVPKRADFERAIAIEAMAWKGHAGTGIANDHRVAHLYEAMLRMFGPQGRAHLSFLRAGGQRIALLLSVEDDRTLYALKIGYDPAHANWSPGHLVVWQVALDAEQRGLRQLDFVGRQDDWKRKWTELSHEQVSVLIYRRSLRGLGTYALREKLKPALPERSLLERGCQRDDHIGAHTLAERVAGRLDHGLGIRSGVQRLLHASHSPSVVLGTPSSHAVGSWVRVRERHQLRASLDQRGRCRGLVFVPAQWETAGQVHRVAAEVRRIRDDRGRMRPVHRTVLLEGVTCAGSGSVPMGCGRHCPLMYRDEWLEPADPPRREPPGASTARHARVRSVEQIRRGLDAFGRRDGLRFMANMESYAEKRFRVAAKLDTVFEYDAWVPTRRPVYVLEGVVCDGSTLGKSGPCQRACALLWHEDWLIFDTEAAADS
jgi:CelD/BcsL family acetyltransferase involved in cellulose biosynthesis